MEIIGIEDPRGEYQRICPYCGEMFTAHHMTQRYCPEKNGVRNFCKNRNKRIMDSLKTEATIAESEKTTAENSPVLQNNIRIIKGYLKKVKSIELDVDVLVQLGFDFEAYNFKKQIPDSELYIAIYGNYAIIWKSFTRVFIFHKIELLWMS